MTFFLMVVFLFSSTNAYQDKYDYCKKLEFKTDYCKHPKWASKYE